jgi:hypothetical protein
VFNLVFVRIVTLFLFGLYLLHSVFLFRSISEEGKRRKEGHWVLEQEMQLMMIAFILFLGCQRG